MGFVCKTNNPFINLKMNYFNQYDQSPPQIILTNQWWDTNKVGRDNMLIKRDKEKAEIALKRERKKEKVFNRVPGRGEGVVSDGNE